LLILDVDRVGRDVVDNDSVSWYDEFCMLSKTSNLSSILLELCSFGCRAGKDLYVATFKLMCSNYLD
jgi:hypothetical protein